MQISSYARKRWMKNNKRVSINISYDLGLKLEEKNHQGHEIDLYFKWFK